MRTEPQAPRSPIKTPKRNVCAASAWSPETDELVFLPHAAYLCATCLDEIQTVRDKQTGK